MTDFITDDMDQAAEQGDHLSIYNLNGEHIVTGESSGIADGWVLVGGHRIRVDAIGYYTRNEQ